MKRGKLNSLSPFALAAGLIGCQKAQIMDLNNPSQTNFITKETARNENCFNGLPRTYSESNEMMKDNFKRVPYDVLETIDCATNLVGVRSLRGEYFGKDLYSPGVFDEDNSKKANFMPIDEYKGKTAKDHAKYFGVVHAPDTLIGLVHNGALAVRHAYKGVSQLINMGAILPITLNTSERAEYFGEPSNYDPRDDKAKFVIDGITDVVKAPVKYVLSSSGKSSTPYSWKLLWYDLKKWVKVDVPKHKTEPLELRLEDKDGNIDKTRFAIGLLPRAYEFLDGFYGTTRKNPKTNKQVVDTDQYDGMATNLKDDVQFHKNQNLKKAPGVIAKDGKFYPAKSWLNRLTKIFGRNTL